MKKGTQVCIDIENCDSGFLNDAAFLEDLLSKAIKESGFILVEDIKMHQFHPYGVTGYALLSSSHIAIHTWPEYNFASVDIFACDSKEKVMKAMDIILQNLKPCDAMVSIFKRGFITDKIEEMMKVQN